MVLWFGKPSEFYISGVVSWLSSHVAVLDMLDLLSHGMVDKQRADKYGLISRDCYVILSALIDPCNGQICSLLLDTRRISIADTTTGSHGQ